MAKQYSQIADFTDGLDELKKIARDFGVSLQHTTFGWQFHPKDTSYKSDEEKSAAASQLNQRWGALKADYAAGTIGGSDRDRADGKIDGIYG